MGRPEWIAGVRVFPFLLGVVQGHFDIRQDVAFTSELETDAAYVKVNSGIAVVIPAQRIIDLLNEPEFLEAREAVATRGEASEPAAASDAQVQPAHLLPHHPSSDGRP